MPCATSPQVPLDQVQVHIGVHGLGLGVLEQSQPSTPLPAVVLILEFFFADPI